MTTYLYSPWKCGITNYNQKNTTLMDERFLGAPQPQMKILGQVVTLRYTPGVRTLSCVQSTDKLYVLGHCEAGAKTIESGVGEIALTANELAIRLHENGLRDQAMAIKFYACSGGSGKLFHKSFASRLLTELRKLNYQLIKIHAYTRTVTQKQKVDDKGFHKWALDNKGRIVGRASEFRKTFT